MIFAAYACLLPVLAIASSVDVYHRVFVPGYTENSFVQRGIIDSLDSQFRPSPSLSQHWLDFERYLQDLSSGPLIDLDHALYQVALEREGSEWDISSVKLCHIPFITSESITLLARHSSQNSPPYAIDYFVSPIPDDGTCPKHGAARKATFPSSFHAMASLNTTIVHGSATLPPLPQLRTPPPLTAEGAPVQPPPEKSFIQKYWMYITAALLVLMMTGGGPEEEGQSRAGQ
ncbi:hypothetical protein GYMLUDRAFT_36802 [Collybiopsis luxurians FD-317 M1]|nr:hypothetical protein GYMLUDRAFT_36802 [Collybiopsis luxurians FD-317 M1]